MNATKPTTEAFSRFKVMTFDVVGTLIDFEGGLTGCLGAIAAERGVRFDPEAALSLYRAARYSPDAQLFPDDLARVYLAIAPALGLPAEPALGQRLKASVKGWEGFADSRAALAALSKRYKLVAMTNAQRWAFELFDAELGHPFHKGFTTDDTGTEKPNPAFFETVLAALAQEGYGKADILHVAQSQYHDIGISRRLGLANCWIERRHGLAGYGGTIEPENFTQPDFHFTSMAELASAALGRATA